MDTSSAVRAYGFPAQIMEAEIERFGVRESFTWGPQTLWLLCGFLWLFYYLVRDIPEVNRATLLFCAGASLLALLGAAYEMRRRNRQIVLYPRGGRIGLYRGGQFQYSFDPAQMVRQSADWIGWIMVLLKLLLPMLLIMVIIGVLMFDGLKQPGPHRWQDMMLFVYAMLFTLFGFVALYRSHMGLAFFWIPNGKGKTNTPLHLHPRELRKIEDPDGMSMR
jgi:hypothetical protein